MSRKQSEYEYAPSEPLTSERAESLFDLERDLRQAALDYAAIKSDDNRKKLREAAISYADFANHLDELSFPKGDS